MRESRWRSMSIMDLNLTKRKASLASSASSSGVGAGGASAVPLGSHTGGQSYELIKSTQSLVERLHLNAQDITIQPVHPSIIGQDTWFQITYTSSGTTRYFSCQNAKERDEWIQSLKKTLMLTEDRRRTDNCLKLSVLEVKGLRDKKKYYVEILVDDKLYARTSSKKMGGMCFWGEHFEFKDLPRTDKISLLIHKDKGGGGAGGGAGKSKKPKKPVGRVKISIPSVQSRYIQEKWHPVEKSSRRESPSIRLKCQFQSVDILPLRDYEDFLYFLKDEYKSICKTFEPHISVKVKEELSYSLMSVFHSEDIAEDVLAEIVVDEISSVENEHLTFRGNSIATKAMESYIKLVGQRYLQSTLQSVITEIILSEVDLEVDPVKVGNPDALLTHRQNLRTVVKQVWSRIAMSYSYFPIQLQRCFYKIRQYLEHLGKPEVGDNLISSCIFLRYLCPAVLSPSLFQLNDEYPSERANRNLTLIAKTMQTLANFTRYEGKENSMEFLNSFLEEESLPMRNFLRQISSPLAEDGWIPNLSSPLEKTDLGRHLSCLHTILFENISKVPNDTPRTLRLRELLDEINSVLHRPTIPQLEQISQPTMTTLKQIQSNSSMSSACAGDQASSSKSSFPWSWTLPKKSKNGERNPSFSHPAPHHAIDATPSKIGPNFFAKPEPGISLSSDTSSSTSLTPSPGAQMKSSRHHWPSCPPPHHKTSISSSSSASSSAIGVSGGGGGATGGVGGHRHSTDLPSRRSKLFPSTMSLDDTDSSDDSTYSSQYQSSDATSTPRCLTLPRPLTGGGHGYSAHYRNQAIVRGGAGGGACGSGGGAHYGQGTSIHRGGDVQQEQQQQQQNKSLSDYEQEVMELRSAMETLQVKLGDAERRLQTQTQNDPPSLSPSSSTSSPTSFSNMAKEDNVKEVVSRLMFEEDQLRRDQMNMPGDVTDKERMILMQQKKIAALDEANSRLVRELERLGDKLSGKRPAPATEQNVVNVSVTTPTKIHTGATATAENVQETPKTVAELLDSLHSTPI